MGTFTATAIILLLASALAGAVAYICWLEREHRNRERALADILANLPAIHDWMCLCPDLMHRYSSTISSWHIYGGPYKTENRARLMQEWEDLYESPRRKADDALDNITKAAGADPAELVRPYDPATEPALMRRRKDVLDFVDRKGR